MGKSTITPMDYYYYQLHIHKISKKDLEEAGIIIDYTDDAPYIAARKIRENGPDYKGDNVKAPGRWVFFALIMAYVSVIVWLGVFCVANQDQGSLRLDEGDEVHEVLPEVGRT